MSKAATYKIGDYQLIDKFPGYRAREDATILPPSTLVYPSQNVVINTAGRISLVKGYELDGDASAVIDSGILSNFDFTTVKGKLRNLRAGFLTDAGNDGKLQYRYVDANGDVSWIDLMTGLTNVRLCFTEYWDNNAALKDVLWVDGTNNIFSWNGGVTTFASATVNTLTKEGTTTWAEEGFYSASSITINGVTATYTGGYNTTTLTGVSVDFSAVPVGSEIHQTPITTALSSMTSILATLAPTVIGCGRRNQVYVGSNTSNLLYISKVNSFTDYSFTSPTRVTGEGALIPLDSPPVKFIAQEVRSDEKAYDMYISEGKDTWSIIRATLSADNTKEQLERMRLKTSPLQGALSERLAAKMKNHIIFVGNDNVANMFGYVSYQFVPVMSDFSFPIIDDMNSYDFTDGSIFFYKNYIYIAVPKHGIVRIYNMTDQSKQSTGGIRATEDVTEQPWFWEAPITYPISGFYVVDGEIYGHSYTTSESYKLFSTGSLNGQDIDANATFAFDDKGERTQSKRANEIWIEGYIKQNTKLNAVITGDLDAFASSQTVIVDGNDSAIVGYGAGGGSIGKDPIGSKPLGGTSTSQRTLPAYFHVAKTYAPDPFYLEQISFNTKGVDLQWELITFGTNAVMTVEGNVNITQ